MTCRTFHTLLAAAEAVLSEAGATWVRKRCLEPHARRCEACRTHLRRRERLEPLVRSALLGGALSEVLATQPAPAASPTPAAPAWRRPAIAVSLAAGLAVLGVVRPRQPESHPTGPQSPTLVQGTNRSVRGRGPAPLTRRQAPEGTPQRPGPMAVHGGQPGTPREHPNLGRIPSRPRRQEHPQAGAGTRLATGSARAPREHSPRPELPMPDERYLDGRDPARVAGWMTGDNSDRQVLDWLGRQLPPIEDDFVHLPLPRLANADPHSPGARAAIRKYEEEARVVDNRLFKKVGLALKARGLDEFCVELERLTAVRLRPSRGVQDEKLTLFVKERPAREVMREVARLFGYTWSRSGEPGAYRYELVQDLKSQLAEEEMRSRDFHEALLVLDRDMEVYRPHLGLSPAELRTRADQATGKEQKQFRDLFFKWGAVQLYQRLTPAHFEALRQQRRLRFEVEGSQPQPGADGPVEFSLPAEWRAPLLESVGVGASKVGGVIALGLVHPSGATTASPWLGLQIKQSELGQVTLEFEQGVTVEGGASLARHWTIARGQSPSTARPDNAAANAALKSQPPFTRKVSIAPEPSCPQQKNKEPGPEPEARSGITPDPLLDRPHVTSADVWEAVHHATGLPIVADAYTRLHPVSRVTIEDATLFDALSKLGDELRLRWKKDGDYLLARSTSYFWDKLKEIPNRHLERWAAIRHEKGALPLETLLEMVALSDRQLDSADVGRAAVHCGNLVEWGLFGAGQPRNGYTSAAFARNYYRLLALLTPDQRRIAQQPGGLPFAALNPSQQAELARLQIGLVGHTLHAAYVPAGWYTWEPRLRQSTDQHLYRSLPVVSEATAESALLAARKVHPAAQPEQIRKSAGILVVWFSGADGARGFGVGRPPIAFTPD